MARAQQVVRAPPPRASWAKRPTARSRAPAKSLITLLPPPPPVRVHLADDAPSARQEQGARAAAEAIAQRGFCVCEGVLGADVVATARNELAALFQRGAMRPGGYTIGGRDDAVAAQRDDSTLWLHEFLHAAGGPSV